MSKTGYIVAFNSKDQHSVLYRRFKSLKSLINILEQLWNSDEDFIVVSLRIYKEKGEIECQSK